MFEWRLLRDCAVGSRINYFAGENRNSDPITKGGSKIPKRTKIRVPLMWVNFMALSKLFQGLPPKFMGDL
jgi:hypothetical protein